MTVDNAGYRVGYAVAEGNLRLGHIVVADSANPLSITRVAWLDVARRAETGVLSKVDRHGERWWIALPSMADGDDSD